MPYLNTELISRLHRSADGFDLVFPKFGPRLQMLHAFYSKNCLPVIEEQLRRQDLRLQALIGKVNSKVIELNDVGRSFTNINTPDDFQKVVAHVN
jgi:molybdopterin-guanine dinucleotide biosynthesis protein A